MKVPNFKDTQVFSHLDGIGYVNVVSIDKNIHFIINFQNGSTKSFLIPLAFNSGLLSTQDRQLAGYLSSLSQDGTIKEPAKANTDIPTSSELNLTITDKYALTKQRLAMLGALDDFYQLYVDVYDFIIQQMINYSKSVFKNRNQNYAGEILFYFPDSIKPRLRKLFEPLLNKYIYIFTNEFDRIFASAYAFNYFPFFFTHGSKYVASTFDDFCKSIEDVYINTFFKWKLSKNPTITKKTVFKLVNTRIQILTVLEQKKILLPSISACSSPQNNILWVMSSLSSTMCYKQKHSIVPKSYIAPLMDSSNCITLPVHYCETCCKYFIGDKTLREYEKHYGKVLVTKQRYKDSSASNTTFFSNFNPESTLHQYGYNVRSNGLTESVRRNLLINLIEKDQLSYHEICRTIEQSISLFQGNPQYTQAISKWKSDLKFIGDYIKSKK